MHELDTLYDTCDMLSKELEEYNDKIRKAGGKLSAGDLDVVDTLTHAIKSAKTTIAMIEAEAGRSKRGRSYEGYEHEVSNARGRMGNIRRDDMGRFSRDDAEDELMHNLREYMDMVDEPAKKQKIKRMMKDLSEM